MEVVKITKKMYGWSKYGGARKGLFKEDLDKWACQLCGTKHNRALPSYFIPETENQREFYRICSSCLYVMLREELETYSDMLTLKVANLISLPQRL